MRENNIDSQHDNGSINPVDLKRYIHQHLLELGMTEKDGIYSMEGGFTKQGIRDFHSFQRHELLKHNRLFIETYGRKLINFIANGVQVDPKSIDPELIEVKADTLESRLFRFACLLWSVPVSKGFGRRMRFLVRDRQNGCLIGVFALGDPVFNLGARDNWIGWSNQDRMQRLVHVMDGYVIGALPPYTFLIGGKLVASLMCSEKIKDTYERKYFDRQRIISNKSNNASLVLLTTTSALGRSSIYNRLKISGGPHFTRIGATKGFGHFQISEDIFESLRSFLASLGHPYASGYNFGMGPNWRIRVVRTALGELGLNADSILRHGIARDVYAVPLAHNWQDVLLGKETEANSCFLSISRITDYCLKRWIIPRSTRDCRFKEFYRDRVIKILENGGPGPSW